MKLHPRLSRAAVELVKRFEGLRLQAARLPGGGHVIGYGHTLTARAGAEVTAADADALLWFDLSRTAERVEAVLTAPVTDAQFEALTAFAFNVGAETFAGSEVLGLVNARAYLQAAAGLELWRRAELDGDALVIDALVRRRAAEKAHFLSADADAETSPGALLRPRLDPGGPDADLRTAVSRVRLEGGEARAILADPPGRLGEPAPSALTAAAAALTARLDAILAEPEPPPFVRESEIAPAPLVEPEVEAGPVEPRVPEAAAPAAEGEPVWLEDAAPFPAAPESPPLEPEAEPPTPEPASASLFGRAAPAADDPDLADLPPPAQVENIPRRDWLRTEQGGRRPLWRKLASHPLLFTGLGAAGLVMFVCAVIGILGGKPAFGGLVLGLAGVMAMAPAAAWFLSRRFDPGS